MPSKVRTADEVEVDLRPLRAPTESTTTARTSTGETAPVYKPGMTMDPRRLAMLQRSAGNAAVATLVRPRPQPRPPAALALQRKAAPDLEHGPSKSAEQAAGPGLAAAGPVDSSDLTRGLAAGPPRAAPPKALDDPRAGQATVTSAATKERAAIVADAAASNAKLDEELAAAQGKLGGQVGAAKAVASGALAEATRATGLFFTTKHAEVMTATAQVEQSAVQQVGAMVGAAQGVATAAHGQIRGVASGISSAVRGQITGVASRIAGAITGISLPDIPGVGAIRNGIASLVRGAANGVTNGIGFVERLIQRALSAGLDAVRWMLDKAGTAARTIIQRIGAAVRAAATKAANALKAIATKVSTALSNVLRKVIFPALDKLRATASKHLVNGQRKAKQAVKLNTDHHLAALDKVAKTAVPAGAHANAGGTPTGGGDDPAATFHAISQRSKDNNGIIVNTVTGRFGAVLASIAGMALAGARNVASKVRGLASEVVATVSGKVQAAIGIVRDLGSAVAGFLGSVLGGLRTAVGRAVDWVKSAATAPAEQLRTFGSNALSSATSFISRAISNVLSGNFSLPSLGLGAFQPTAAMDGPVPTDAVDSTVASSSLSALQIVGIVVAALAAIVALPFIISALVGLTLLALAAMVLFGPLLLLAAILYGLYRFVKWVATPSPLEVTHDTDLQAPDGSPKTRLVVGVGERVLLKASKLSSWKATTGDPTSTAPKAATRWRAPFTAGSAEVTATMVDKSQTQKVAFTVVEPASIKAEKESDRSFASGEQGVGMVLDFVYGPSTVSFGGGVAAREKPGPASAIKGYYLREGMPHDHKPESSEFFHIAENNHLANGVRDKASQFGQPKPWEAGSFHWNIPNEFIADEEASPKVFTTTTQEFVMADETGTTTVTKAGASATRKP